MNHSSVGNDHQHGGTQFKRCVFFHVFGWFDGCDIWEIPDLYKQAQNYFFTGPVVLVQEHRVNFF